MSPIAKAKGQEHSTKLQVQFTKSTMRAKLRQRWEMDLVVTPADALKREGKRKRDAAYRVTGKDIDDLVKPLLIRLASAYLDQGIASVPMPDRELGFLRVFQSLYQEKGFIAEPWMNLLPAKVTDHMSGNCDASVLIVWALREQ